MFTLVKEGQGNVIQKNKARGTRRNACKLQDTYALEKAIKHLEKCEQAQAENEKLTQLLDEVLVNVDRLEKKKASQRVLASLVWESVPGMATLPVRVLWMAAFFLPQLLSLSSQHVVQ